MIARSQYIPWALALALLLGWRARPVFSEPTTQPAAVSQQLSGYVAQLGNDDPQKRQAALDHLMALDSAQLPALRAAALAQAPLLPVQVAAIRQAVIQIYLAGLPYDYATDPQTAEGFLGISGPIDSENPSTDGVPVSQRIVGFVAYRMLRTGDVLVKILRQPQAPDVDLHDFNQFCDLIRPMRPGEILRMEILRYGRPMEISIPLDHRPLEVDQPSRQQWFNQREQAAEDYWNQQFSAIDRPPAPPTTRP